jgi:hypothetical protein
VGHHYVNSPPSLDQSASHRLGWMGSPGEVWRLDQLQARNDGAHWIPQHCVRLTPDGPLAASGGEGQHRHVVGQTRQARSRRW